MKDTIILQEVSAILHTPCLPAFGLGWGTGVSDLEFAMRDYKGWETGTACGKPKDDDDKSTTGPLQLAVTWILWGTTNM